MSSTRRRWLAIGVSVSVFIVFAIMLDALFQAQFVGWLGLLPAGFVYWKVRERLRYY
jgi:hypothetical protein